MNDAASSLSSISDAGAIDRAERLQSLLAKRRGDRRRRCCPIISRPKIMISAAMNAAHSTTRPIGYHSSVRRRVRSATATRQRAAQAAKGVQARMRAPRPSARSRARSTRLKLRPRHDAGDHSAEQRARRPPSECRDHQRQGREIDQHERKQRAGNDRREHQRRPRSRPQCAMRMFIISCPAPFERLEAERCRPPQPSATGGFPQPYEAVPGRRAAANPDVDRDLSE